MSNWPEPPAKRALEKEVPAEVRLRARQRIPQKILCQRSGLMGSLASAAQEPSAFFDRFELPRPLKWEMPLPDFFRQVPDRGLAGRRRMSGVLLVPHVAHWRMWL